MKIHKERQDYTGQKLSPNDLENDPLSMFRKWYEQAKNDEIEMVNAATLSTLGSNGEISARVILIKEIRDDGLVFFTDYSSQKGKDLVLNANCHLNIYWKEHHRQVRFSCLATKTSREESHNYFQSRPKESKVSAIISKQSSVTRENELEDSFQEAIDLPTPTPDRWGGYFLKVKKAEFWQGRENRLHDRFQFIIGENGWETRRLAP